MTMCGVQGLLTKAAGEIPAFIDKQMSTWARTPPPKCLHCPVISEHHPGCTNKKGDILGFLCHFQKLPMPVSRRVHTQGTEYWKIDATLEILLGIVGYG